MKQQKTNKKLSHALGITRYYHQLYQSENKKSYYVEPRETCPLDILNNERRFVIISFDKRDGYVVVGGRHYYLNKLNSIKCSNRVLCRVAIVDIDELENTKSYDYDAKYNKPFTAHFNSFKELRDIAEQQWHHNGAPYVKQRALFDPVNLLLRTFKPSVPKKSSGKRRHDTKPVTICSGSCFQIPGAPKRA